MEYYLRRIQESNFNHFSSQNKAISKVGRQRTTFTFILKILDTEYWNNKKNTKSNKNVRYEFSWSVLGKSLLFVDKTNNMRRNCKKQQELFVDNECLWAQKNSWATESVHNKIVRMYINELAPKHFHNSFSAIACKIVFTRYWRCHDWVSVWNVHCIYNLHGIAQNIDMSIRIRITNTLSVFLFIY